MNSCDNSPAQVHSVTRPPICNSVHSNKVTQANSLALTGAARREEPTPTHTDLRNPTLASPRSASNTGERRSGRTFLLHPQPVYQRPRPRLSPPQTSSQPALSVYAPDPPPPPASPRDVELDGVQRRVHPVSPFKVKVLSFWIRPLSYFK